MSILFQIWTISSEKYCSKFVQNLFESKTGVPEQASVNLAKFIHTPAEETEMLNIKKGGNEYGVGDGWGPP